MIYCIIIRLKTSLSRYKALMKGYDVSGVTDLYHENERLKVQNKVSKPLG